LKNYSKQIQFTTHNLQEHFHILVVNGPKDSVLSTSRSTTFNHPTKSTGIKSRALGPWPILVLVLPMSQFW